MRAGMYIEGLCRLDSRARWHTVLVAVWQATPDTARQQREFRSTLKVAHSAQVCTPATQMLITALLTAAIKGTK